MGTVDWPIRTNEEEANNATMQQLLERRDGFVKHLRQGNTISQFSSQHRVYAKMHDPCLNHLPHFAAARVDQVPALVYLKSMVSIAVKHLQIPLCYGPVDHKPTQNNGLATLDGSFLIHLCGYNAIRLLDRACHVMERFCLKSNFGGKLYCTNSVSRKIRIG